MIFNQVNKLLSTKHKISTFFRCAHKEQQSSYAKVLFPLDSKELLKVSGNDASVFLQGLITNDMRHFEDGAKSIYTMFLNNKGRVMYDTLIYKWEDNTFMLECDKRVINIMMKHLNLYKMRRAVKIEDVSQFFRIWALISPLSGVPDLKVDPASNMNIFKDPRLADLGNRIVSRVTLRGPQIADTIGKDIIIGENEDGYKYLRYKLGICEGSEELVPGVCLPLEVNCDYLHGVSFHKGCYIGQELTARVHHTGVVRKRIMPIKFNDDILETIKVNTEIYDGKNQVTVLGKLKGFLYDYGVGLVRVKESLDAKTLSIGNYKAEILKPNWWPAEAPRDVVTKSEKD